MINLIWLVCLTLCSSQVIRQLSGSARHMVNCMLGRRWVEGQCTWFCIYIFVANCHKWWSCPAWACHRRRLGVSMEGTAGVVAIAWWLRLQSLDMSQRLLWSFNEHLLNSLLTMIHAIHLTVPSIWLCQRLIQWQWEIMCVRAGLAEEGLLAHHNLPQGAVMLHPLRVHTIYFSENEAVLLYCSIHISQPFPNAPRHAIPHITTGWTLKSSCCCLHLPQWQQ